VPQLPGVHPRAHLVLLMSGRRDEVGEHRVSLSLVDPDGIVRLEHHGAVQMHEPPPGEGEVESPGVIVLDLPAHAAGSHAIVVTIDGAEAARVPFTVSLPPRAAGQVH